VSTSAFYVILVIEVGILAVVGLIGFLRSL